MAIKSDKKRSWPRWPLIDDLPADEQKPFLLWLAAHTVPVNDDGTVGYYHYDYRRWKDSLKSEK